MAESGLTHNDVLSTWIPVSDGLVMMKNESILGSRAKNSQNKALMTTQYTIQNK